MHEYSDTHYATGYFIVLLYFRFGHISISPFKTAFIRHFENENNTQLTS